MDGVSAAASVIAVAQIAWQVLDQCQTYYKEVKGARKDILHLQNEVALLGDILETLSDDTDPANPSSMALLIKEDGPLQQCREALQDLNSKLKPGEGENKMRQFGVRALKWPFSSKDVEKLLKVIIRHKDTFNLALTGDNIALSRKIKDEVAALGGSIAEMRVEQKSFLTDVRWKDIRYWLSAPDPSPNHNAACSLHQISTGAWFLESEEFKAWKTDSNSFLWLHGIPGCGKTILSSTIIEDVTQCWKSDPAIAVAYFYFDFHTTEKMKYDNLLRSLIVQLSVQSTKVPESLTDLFSHCQDGQHQPTIDALTLTLRQILETFQQVFIILDALDECNEREKLLLLLETIFNWHLDKLHILSTSRRETDIEDCLEPLVTGQISIQSARVNSDIRIYIDERLGKDPKLKAWSPQAQIEIKETLMSGADGMFRWVVCQLDALGKVLKQGRLRTALKSLPKSLDETYDRILCSIDEEYSADAFKILQWLAHSTRPLDLAEVAEVVSVEFDNDPRFDPENRLREPRDILTICSSLVTTVTLPPSDEDGHIYHKGAVRLAHFSVKEYLISDRIQKGGASQFAIDKDDEGHVAQTCLAYLLHFSEPAMLTPSHVNDFPLLEYAANYWFIHTKRANRNTECINDLGLKLFQSSGAYFNWIRLRDLDLLGLGADDLVNRDVDRRLNFKLVAHPLYYASLAGLADLARLLLKDGANVNAKGGKYNNALQAASAEGYHMVVELLLESGAEINAKGGRDTTALLAACSEGHEDVVRVLLEGGADPDIQADGSFNYVTKGATAVTALQVACYRGNKSIVKLLLENGADINGQADAFNTPLRIASRQGNETVMELLLKNGADINAGGRYNTTLQEAFEQNGDAVIRRLVEMEAKVNKSTDWLQSASFYGRYADVQWLLENGANANAQGGDLDTALQAASLQGHVAVVKLLLENGANVDAQGGAYESALQAASFKGHEEIVRLLLENGADVNAQGGECNSALQSACLEGHESIVKLLLEKGADVNIFGGLYQSALYAACFGAADVVVGLLLASGIDVRYYSGGIQAAATAAWLNVEVADSRGWCRVVKLLHEHGASTSADGFLTACATGHEAMVRLMLENGFDFTPDDSFYRTAIERTGKGEGSPHRRPSKRTFENGYLEIVELLNERIVGESG